MGSRRYSGQICATPFGLLDRDVGVAGVGASVDEGDELGRVLFKGLAGNLFAVLGHRLEVMEQSDLGTDLLKLRGIGIFGVADQIGGSLGLGAGPILEGLGFEIILVTAEAPVAEIVLVEVFAGLTELLDDDLVWQAVIDHLVDLLGEDFG